MHQARNDLGYPVPSGWGNVDHYGYRSSGAAADMANAFLNHTRSGGIAGKPEKFEFWLLRQHMPNERRRVLRSRGWWGRPRVPERCQVGTTGICTCAKPAAERVA